MLSTAAFNALLKTLEEPPAHVKFMFATTDPEKVLATILSRCQRFDLRRIPTALIVKHLGEIAKKENVTVDDAALYAIARGADGGMRDAESTLDQLISFCGDKIEEPDVLSMFGLAAQGQILGLSHAVLAGEIHTTLHQLNDLSQKGKDLGRLLSDLLSHFRNLILFQVSKGDLSLMEVSEAEAGALKEQSLLATTDALTRILEVLADAELRLRDAASKKILLEVTLLRAIEARNAVSIDAVLKQLNALRGQGGVVAPSAPAPVAAEVTRRTAPQVSAPPVAQQAAPPIPPPHVGDYKAESPAASAPVAAAPTSAAFVASEDLEALWSQLVDAITRASRFRGGYLINAHPVAFAKGLLTIGYDLDFEDQMGLADNPGTHTLIQTKLAELGHPNSQVKFIKAEAPAGRVRLAPVPAPNTPKPTASPTGTPKPTTAPAKEKSTPVSFSKDDFKNDPLIQKALEVFKGQIVEVRA